MGDTGALLLGLICSILTIEFIELNALLGPENPFRINAAPGVAISILILPLFDTLRVFITRLINGRHPLQPDRNHIHHLLLDFGLTHMQATVVLASLNILFILLAFTMQKRNSDTLTIIMMLFVIASLLVGGLYFSLRRKAKA
jgi:UDP-N-acetylmuramyl pentapeptide phosphotransferase/UDP-N-acetylglucosamine-1-phosphate transferase